MNAIKLIALFAIINLGAMASDSVHCTRGKHVRQINVVKLRSVVYPYGYEIRIAESEWLAINQSPRCPANSFTMGCSLSPEQASLLPSIAEVDREESCHNGFCLYDTGGWEKSPQAVKTKTLPKVVETLKSTGWSCR